MPIHRPFQPSVSPALFPALSLPPKNLKSLRGSCATDRVCGNWSTKGRHGTVTTCENLTSFPTDGAFAPIILVGSNFSWAGRNSSSGGPTCRIDPYHGGSIFISKGQNVNAYDIAINYVTFPGECSDGRLGL